MNRYYGSTFVFLKPRNLTLDLSMFFFILPCVYFLWMFSALKVTSYDVNSHELGPDKARFGSRYELAMYQALVQVSFRLFPGDG
jgi:hypothetical protein